ncbi:MAG: GNA1162 family protein [Deltaproteobacteria bacterium]
MKTRYSSYGIEKGFVFLLFALILLTGGCAFHAMGPPPNPGNPYQSIAVLPLYNATNDVDGPKMVRELVDGRVRHMHYDVKPVNEVDQILRDRMGVALGAQLELTTPQKLGEELGVDAVLYGYLLNFETVTAGVYNVKKVRAGFRLVDTKTGRTIWAHGLGVKQEISSGGLLGAGVGAARNLQDAREGLEPFKSVKGLSEVQGITEWRLLGREQEKSVTDAAMFSLGEKLVTKALGVHLKHESETLINMLFSRFPVGPGQFRGGAPHYAPAPAPPMPKFEMPDMALPGYFEFGKRDFTADMIMSSFSAEKNREFVVTGRLYRRGMRFRSDMDMTSALKTNDPDAMKLSKVFFIEHGPEKKSYVLYPEMKRYMEKELVRSRGEGVKIERRRLGEETIDGHRCVKYGVRITENSGSAHNGTSWEAKDLGGFLIRYESEEQGVRFVMELKNVRLVSPPEALFIISDDYTRAESMMDIFMGER